MIKHCIGIVYSLAVRHEKFIKYCFIGVAGVSTDFLVCMLLHSEIGVHYQLANFISISCGILTNFILNAYLNFKRYDRILIRFLQFYLIGLAGICLNALLLILFVEFLKRGVYSSKLINMVIIAVVQYGLNKTFSFREFRGNGPASKNNGF